MEISSGVKVANRIRRSGMVLLAMLLVAVAGMQQLYGQTNKYHIEYTGKNDVTGPPYTFNRVNSMELIGNGGKFCYDFFIQECSGSYDAPGKPTSLVVSAWQYEGTNSQSAQRCYDTDTYPINICDNVVIWTPLCGTSYYATVTVSPIVTTTGNPAPAANNNIGPGTTITLTATSGFSSYGWQYKYGSNDWRAIRTTTGNTTTVSSADIEGHYLQAIYFRAIAEGCQKSVTTPVGPYTFTGAPVSVPANGFTPDAPLCRGGRTGKITITTLSRALSAGETVSITLQDAVGNDLATSLTTSTLPIVLDGSNAQFQNLIPAGSFKIFAQSFINGVPANSGNIVYTDVVVAERAALTASAAVTSSYNGAMIRCVGYSDGVIAVTASGGAGGFQYSSDNGTSYQASNAFSGLPAANYSFKVKDVYGCTTTTAAVTISPPTVVTVSGAYATSDNGSGGHTSCNLNDTGGTKNDGVVRIDASGGSGALQYSLAGGTYSAAYQSSMDITSLYPDSYTVSVKDANGCVSANHPVVKILQPTEITYTDIVHTDVVCNGVPTGTVEVQGASGGIGTFKYSINGSVAQSANVFANLSANTYTVTIIDSKGCTKVTGAEVVDQPKPFVFSAINSSLQSCTGIADGTISLTPATGGTAPLQYSVDDQTYINESATITFSGLVSGNYKVYVQDSKGCKGITNKYVDIKPAITGGISVSQPISCNGQTDGALNLTPGGGTAPYTFAWSTQATTEDISALGNGIYTVDITDSKGCVKQFQYDLQQPGVLSLQPVVSDYHGYGVSCVGSADGAITLTPQGGTTPYAYSWSTGSTQKDLTALAPGGYDVTVTDAHNCQASISQIVITKPLPVGLSLGDFKNISCFGGTDGQLVGIATGGAGSYEYSLDGTIWQSDASFIALNAKAYTLQMRDANRCTATPVGKTLTEPTKLTLTKIKQVDTSCGESNGSAQVEAGGGVGSYVYTWYDESNAAVSNTADAITLASGDYQATVLDGNACKTELLVIINTSDGPKITQQLLQGLTCHDSNDGAIGISISEGQAPYTVAWDTQESSLAVTNVTGGEHWVEVHDVKGCRAKAVFDVPYPPALALDYTASNPLCTGNADGSLAITVSGGNMGGYTINWSTGNTGATIADLKAGTYQVTVKDVRNCTLQRELVLIDPPVFTVDAGGDRTICVGQKLSLHAEEDNATYLWTSDAGYNSATRDVVLTVPARYTLKVVSANGCIAEDSFTLATSNDLLTADFLMATEAHAGDTVVLIDVSWPVPETIDWRLPQNASVLSEEDMYADVVFNSPGEYEVLLTTHLGECVSTYTKTITILDERDPQNGRTATDLVTRFDVFPNPNDGEFSIRIELSEEATGRLRMLALSGNATLVEESLTGATAYNYEAALQSVPSGVYFLVLELNGRQYTKRVIIK